MALPWSFRTPRLIEAAGSNERLAVGTSVAEPSER